jgi:hypothetical protein
MLLPSRRVPTVAPAIVAPGWWMITDYRVGPHSPPRFSAAA